jgi:hypothetical protein
MGEGLRLKDNMDECHIRFRTTHIVIKKSIIAYGLVPYNVSQNHPPNTDLLSQSSPVVQ